MLKKQHYVEPQAEVLEVQGEAVLNNVSGGPLSLPDYEEEEGL